MIRAIIVFELEGGAVNSNGIIYGVLYNAKQNLRFDSKTEQTSLIGCTYDGASKWEGGAMTIMGVKKRKYAADLM